MTAAGGEVSLRKMGLASLNLRPGENVLEIGCGTGQALPLLAQSAGVQGAAAGIDLSEGMLKAAQARLAKIKLKGRVSLAQGDAVCLPYAGAAFDAVFMSFTLELFSAPDILCVLSECRRVLKPAGRVCTVTLSQPEASTFMVAAYGWFHRRFPSLVDCRPIPAAALIAQAGFQIQICLNKSLWGLPVAIVVACK